MSSKDNEKVKFRHELKYILTETQKKVFMSRLDGVLDRDPHVTNGVYTIRSLYFDDIYNSAYEEKLMGIQNRKKYRIRCYNYSPDVIKLECKNKQDSYIYKESALFSEAETQKVLDGDYEFLFLRKEEVCRKFYYECTANLMRTKVIVDYERVPYVFNCGDVRITFDSNIRESVYEGDLFERKLPSYFVLEPGELVMEVKFTQLLPELIQCILAEQSALQIAASKYVLCMENRMRRIV